MTNWLQFHLCHSVACFLLIISTQRRQTPWLHQRRKEPPFWLKTLRQTHIKALSLHLPPPTTSPWLGLACRWARPHFVCCHWSWKSIQTDGRPRQVCLLLPSCSSGSYHIVLVTKIITDTIAFVMKEEIFYNVKSVVTALSVISDSQTMVIWEVVYQPGCHLVSKHIIWGLLHVLSFKMPYFFFMFISSPL